VNLGLYFACSKRDIAPALGIAALCLVLPATLSNDYYLNVLVLVLLYAGLASAWNIVGGYAGQFSLGHTAFFGIGAYTSTLLYLYAGVSPWFGLVAGGLLSAALAALVSLPTFRMRGVFFAMATLAIGETVRIVLIYSRQFTGMPYSLSINYEPDFLKMIFAERSQYALLTGGYLAIVLIVTFLLARSYIGFYLQAIRDNEDAAGAAGIDVRRYKLLAFVLSAFLTSVGGTLMAQYVLYIEPGTVFTTALSVDLPLIAILGGIGTIYGPTVGAVILLPLREMLLEQFGGAGSGAHLLVYGALLTVIVIVMPSGLISSVQFVIERLRVSRPASKNPAR
jgi:branched-chain amino acid transport system permease protein